jgi:Mago binding
VKNATTLEDWTQTTRPDGTIRLERRVRAVEYAFTVLIGIKALMLLGYGIYFAWHYFQLPPFIVKPALGIFTLLFLVSGAFGYYGVVPEARRWRLIPWGREEVRLRENYLERRVVFGRWCRVVRITDGWVYVEEVENSGSTTYPTYRVRVRGKGGEVVLLSRPAYGSSILGNDHEVPRSVAQLAEFVAQKTEWYLDVPSLLRRGSQIRTA